MKIKKYILAGFIILGINSIAQAAYTPPIYASRGNCWAVSPVGIGYHNESITYDWQSASRRLWTRTIQQAKDGTKRAANSALSFETTWRAYVGFTDHSGAAASKFWTVNGEHYEEVGYLKSVQFKSSATACNLGQGWPWS